MSQAILKVTWTPSSAAIVTSSWKNNDHFVNYSIIKEDIHSYLSKHINYTYVAFKRGLWFTREKSYK